MRVPPLTTRTIASVHGRLGAVIWAGLDLYSIELRPGLLLLDNRDLWEPFDDRVGAPSTDRGQMTRDHFADRAYVKQ
jgi:hypothetical protein